MASFDGDRYMTSGINATLNPFVQLCLWALIDNRKETEKMDYLQVFRLTQGTDPYEQVIEHFQEMPPVTSLHRIWTADPIKAKVYIIDAGDGTSTMMLANEY